MGLDIAFCNKGCKRISYNNKKNKKGVWGLILNYNTLMIYREYEFDYVSFLEKNK